MKNSASGDALLIAISSTVLCEGQELETIRTSRYFAASRLLVRDRKKLLMEGAIKGRGSRATVRHRKSEEPVKIEVGFISVDI